MIFYEVLLEVYWKKYVDGSDYLRNKVVYLVWGDDILYSF